MNVDRGTVSVWIIPIKWEQNYSRAINLSIENEYQKNWAAVTKREIKHNPRMILMATISYFYVFVMPQEVGSQTSLHSLLTP